MPRRPDPEPLSPRALARLRSRPGSWVPTEADLGAGERGSRWPRGDEDDDVGWPGDEQPPGPLPPGSGDRVAPGAGRHSRARHPRGWGWVRLPAAFVGARWQPGRAAVLGVVVVAAVALAVFGLRVAWAQSAGGGTVLAPGGGSRAGPTGVTAGAVPVGVDGSAGPVATSRSTGPAAVSSAAPGGAAAASMVVVHVVGKVRHPGIRRLPAGSRVADAVEAAGGASAGADLGALNLARVLVDGEQVRVPAPGEVVVPPASSGGGAGGGGGGSGGSGAAGTVTPVSINTADLAALDTLPGVGPVLAQRILDWRAAHGRFTSVDELGEVSGIGEKLLAQLSPLVTL